MIMTTAMTIDPAIDDNEIFFKLKVNKYIL